MTPEKAFKILRDTPIRAKENHIEYSKALHLAMAALQMQFDPDEKQTPKKPFVPWDSITGNHVCPECYMNVSRVQHYCDKCGQALDWSNSK